MWSCNGPRCFKRILKKGTRPRLWDGWWRFFNTFISPCLIHVSDQAKVTLQRVSWRDSAKGYLRVKRYRTRDAQGRGYRYVLHNGCIIVQGHQPSIVDEARAPSMTHSNLVKNDISSLNKLVCELTVKQCILSFDFHGTTVFICVRTRVNVSLARLDNASYLNIISFDI